MKLGDSLGCIVRPYALSYHNGNLQILYKVIKLCKQNGILIAKVIVKAYIIKKKTKLGGGGSQL